MAENNPSVIISSPGKLILHGEHAVVYGKKAVACSLNLRTFCGLTKLHNTSFISVHLPDINFHCKWSIQDLQKLKSTCVQIYDSKCDVPVAASNETITKIKAFLSIPEDAEDTSSMAAISFLYLLMVIYLNDAECSTGLDIQISSCLPTSAGLGSSASYSTCLSAALLFACNRFHFRDSNGMEPKCQRDDLDLINGWAFQSEKLIHGTPSGIDNSICTFGGALLFENGKFSPINDMPKFRILLVNTKMPRSTKTLVASVKSKYDCFPEIIKPLFESIEAISVTFVDIIKQCIVSNDNNLSSCYSQLKELIKMNQKLLDIIGVSHQSLKNICDVAEEFNLSAKLTGAGGGGCAFILIPPDTPESSLQEVQNKVKDFGYDVWETVIGGDGISFHSKDDLNDFVLPLNFKF